MSSKEKTSYTSSSPPSSSSSPPPSSSFPPSSSSSPPPSSSFPPSSSSSPPPSFSSPLPSSSSTPSSFSSPPSSSSSLPPSSSSPPSSPSPPPPSSSPPPPSSPPSFSSSPPPGSHFVGSREEIAAARRVTRMVNGCRDVLVLYHRGELHAMDQRCYHAGGPLRQGDIEEFDGRLCIVCPWHKYKITLGEGECLYQAVEDPRARPLRTRWRSKGIKQRVHKVTEVDGNVYVTLNDSQEAIESDSYQTERYRTTLLKGQPKPRA